MARQGASEAAGASRRLGNLGHSGRLTWENLQFGMREVSNDRPRRLITTTPRPIAILRTIERAASTVVVTGSSYENKANLDPTWIAETLAPYEGTRVGRQEIEAEILEDTPGSLWSREWFDRDRKTAAPDLKRVVVGVDPAVSMSSPIAQRSLLLWNGPGRR